MRIYTRNMPYIILTANGEELERANLAQPLTIGRSAECNIAVRDVLLSRKHCRLEPATGREKGRWRLVDLGSRNGSHVNWKKITEHTLVDGDAVRMGRTWLTFKSGLFEPPPTDVKIRKSRLVRPADPHEALSGTVADFVFQERDVAGQEFDGTPSPSAKSGRSGRTAASPLDDLSSSWDSIVATASSPRRLPARPMPRSPVDAKLSPRKEMDLSLQALPMQVPYLEVVPGPLRRRRRRLAPALILTLGIGLATLLVLVSGWVMTNV